MPALSRTQNNKRGHPASSRRRKSSVPSNEADRSATEKSRRSPKKPGETNSQPAALPRELVHVHAMG